MSDDRWIEVEKDFASSARHFETAAKYYARGHALPDNDERDLISMAFMHAMMAGHSSLEAGMLRIMAIVGEQPPAGDSTHADLISRMSESLPGKRPAFLPRELVDHANETRRFRHVSVRTYDDFKWALAKLPVESGLVITRAIRPALRAFRSIIDPPGNNGGGDGSGGGAAGGPQIRPR